MPNLVVIVPTRSRPQAVDRVIDAWVATNAVNDGAELLFVVDQDDPRYADYLIALAGQPPWVSAVHEDLWRPLVPKLNRIALGLAIGRYTPVIGFAGDDHLPRTPGWVGMYVEHLRKAGTGIAYCDDGYQHENIPTQWAMTADIVRALDAMVPAPVEHLYCDNAVKDLGLGAGVLAYLPNMLIEHMHPVAGKGESDQQYDKVNSRAQYRTDRAAYREWYAAKRHVDVATVVGLLKVRGRA